MEGCGLFRQSLFFIFAAVILQNVCGKWVEYVVNDSSKPYATTKDNDKHIEIGYG